MVDLNTEYRRIVRAEASAEALARSINLVREIARQRCSENPEQWSARSISGLWDIGGTRAAEAGALRRFSINGIDDRFLLESPNWEGETTKEVVTTLVFGATLAKERLKGKDYSLLSDTLLVVFHQSYFALLPKIERNSQDRIALLRSYVYLSSLFGGNPDQFRLQGLVALALGDLKATKDAFRAALLATHSDDHDFMTRLQSLWATMLQEGAYREAVDLLIEIYPKVVRGDLAELGELIRQTFEAAEAARSR